MLQALSTYKLTAEQAADNTLDLLTGAYLASPTIAFCSCAPFVYLSGSLSVCLSVRPSVCLFVCLSGRAAVRLSVCLSVCESVH